MADENVQTAPMASDPQTSDDPVDLAAAFRLVNQTNKEAAAAPVAEEKAGDSSEPEANNLGSGESIQDGGQQAGAEEPADSQDSGASEGYSTGNEPEVSSGDLGQGSGGSTSGASDSVQHVDSNALIQQYQQSARNQAINIVSQHFKQNNIKPEWTIQDLYTEDENTGSVSFINPDDKDNPFRSRAEAQQWVDAMNKQISSQFAAEVRNTERLIMQRNKPTIDMIMFANTYEQLDKNTQDILEDLVEGYEIKNSKGETVGYKCDLMDATRRAIAISKRNGLYKQPENEKKPAPTSPASDMKTGSSDSGSGEFKEPKTIGEAMKTLSQMKKGNNNG